MEEIGKLKKGEFDENLIAATINNNKRDRQKQLESNDDRATWFVESFVNGTNWADEVASLDRMSKITKQELIDFANTHLKDNYVVVNKRQGKDESVKKMTKPAITPIVTNRDKSSAFLREIRTAPVKPIEPVFVDFSKDMAQGKLKSVFLCGIRKTRRTTCSL